MKRRLSSNMIITAICFLAVVAGMFVENLIATLGFGLLFIGLNCSTRKLD